MKFTDKSISALKSRSARYEVWEDGRTGFGLRVSVKGRKTWLYLYRFRGKPRRLSIGVYPAIGMAKAHRLHAEASEMLARGSDPGAVAVDQRIAERNAETVGELIDEYLTRYAEPRKRDKGASDKRALNADIRPRWGDMKAKDIVRRDVIRLLDSVVERGSPIQANRLLQVTRKMFTFGVQRGILESSPCNLIERPSPEHARTRVLDTAEIKSVWTNLDSSKMHAGTRLALKLLLVTGQRRGEVVAAPWSEFDLDAAVWYIPAARIKNGHAHSVPLSDLALDLLSQAKTLSLDSEWVFPGLPRERGRHMDPAAVSRAVRANREHFDIEAFTPHDLRRTFTSGMAKLGIDRLVVQRLLNHLDQSVTGKHYDQYDRWTERVNAMATWSKQLNEIVTGQDETEPGNVVRLQSGL